MLKGKQNFLYLILIITVLIFLKLLNSNTQNVNEILKEKKVVVHITREYENLVLYGGKEIFIFVTLPK
jgi:hypothetical protein